MIWINLLAFQVCWAVCVWGGATQRWWLGPITVLIFLFWELAHSHTRGRMLMLVGLASVIGFIIDSAYIKAGVLRYSSPVPWVHWAPIWIVAIWVAFTLTLNESLAWLRKQPLAAIALGALGGPLAYWVAAETWNAAQFVMTSQLSLIVIGVVWGIATPLLLWLAEQIDPKSSDGAPAA